MKKIVNKICERKYGKKGACPPLKTYAADQKTPRFRSLPRGHQMDLGGGVAGSPTHIDDHNCWLVLCRKVM